MNLGLTESDLIEMNEDMIVDAVTMKDIEGLIYHYLGTDHVCEHLRKDTLDKLYDFDILDELPNIVDIRFNIDKLSDIVGYDLEKPYEEM
ncbi:MAG: hypothetical protein ACRC92_04155 [Peptostreptococcaceae bacterium]